MVATKLPPHFQKYFWDCDFNTLDLQRYSRFIIERILSMGTWEDIQWLYHHVSPQQFYQIATTSRRLDAKTRNFWKSYLAR